MGRAQATFKESTVVRAVKAARKAGLSVAGISVYRDGRIDVRHGAPLDGADQPGQNNDDLLRLLEGSGNGTGKR